MIYLLLIFLLPIVPIVFRVKRRRFALLWILLVYILLAIMIAAIPPFLTMTDTGVGDPQLMAGQISESLVTSMLVSVIVVPLALLVFWGFPKVFKRA